MLIDEDADEADDDNKGGALGEFRVVFYVRVEVPARDPARSSSSSAWS